VRNLRRSWRRAFRPRGNGMTDDTWVPVWCVDRRIVAELLAELSSAGVPARCDRFRYGGRLLPRRSEWCLWVGNSAYRQAQERLAQVMPQLVRSLRGPSHGL
jgi:hypothetical protein